MSDPIRSLLPFFGVVRVRGADRTAFLHNQLSNHIQDLAEGQACYATYNTPKGRVLANMLVLNSGKELLLILAADLIEILLKRLRLYVLRNQVNLETASDWAVAGELPATIPPRPPTVPQLQLPAGEEHGLWHISLPHGGRLLLGAAAALPPRHTAAEQAWLQHEIASGYPWIDAASSESSVAQMLNQHQIGGIHFKKGCYPGQEIIARAQYRGQVKRGLAHIAGPGLLAGDKLVNATGEEVGLIINAADDAQHGRQALAVVKFTATETPLFGPGTPQPLQLLHRFYTHDTTEDGA